jgi:hypothetical protein
VEQARKKELEFLIRIHTPVTLVESRNHADYVNAVYDDFYSLSELVQQGFLDYIGHSHQYFYLRPTFDFSVHIVDEIRNLRSGEIVKLALTTSGRRDFEAWLETSAKQA